MAVFTALLIFLGSAFGSTFGGHAGFASGHLRIMDGPAPACDGGGMPGGLCGGG